MYPCEQLKAQLSYEVTLKVLSGTLCSNFFLLQCRLLALQPMQQAPLLLPSCQQALLQPWQQALLQAWQQAPKLLEAPLFWESNQMLLVRHAPLDQDTPLSCPQ